MFYSQMFAQLSYTHSCHTFRRSKYTDITSIYTHILARCNCQVSNLFVVNKRNLFTCENLPKYHDRLLIFS